MHFVPLGGASVLEAFKTPYGMYCVLDIRTIGVVNHLHHNYTEYEVCFTGGLCNQT